MICVVAHNSFHMFHCAIMSDPPGMSISDWKQALKFSSMDEALAFIEKHQLKRVTIRDYDTGAYLWEAA